MPATITVPAAADDFTLLANAGIKLGSVAVASGFYGNVNAGTQNTTAFSGGGTLHNNDSQTAATRAAIRAPNLISAINAVTPTAPLITIYSATTVTFAPGIKYNASALTFNGTTLEFDAGGDVDAQFFVVSASSIIFGTGTTIALLNGARNINIFWLANTEITFTAVTDRIFGVFISSTAEVTFDNTSTDISGRVYAGTEITFAVASTADPAIVTASIDPPPGDICFLGDTPINTDQGIIPIASIVPKIHTIRGQRILAVTKTVQSKYDYLVCFEKDSLGTNCPSAKTVMSPNHGVLFRGRMTLALDFPAKIIVGARGKVHKVMYWGQHMYNILMDTRTTVLVNNLVCETVDPADPAVRSYQINVGKHVAAAASAIKA